MSKKTRGAPNKRMVERPNRKRDLYRSNQKENGTSLVGVYMGSIPTL